MGRDVTVSFASIRVQVHRGALRETKPLLTDTDAVATLTGQTLLIGARGSWYMKAKDLTALDVSDRVITVSCASKTVIAGRPQRTGLSDVSAETATLVRNATFRNCLW
jgi:hypothetical protein